MSEHPTWYLETADVNQDGKLDIVMGNSDVSWPGSNPVTWALGNGDGTFHSAKSVVVHGVGRDLAVGDLTNDSYPEIIAVTNSGIVVLINDGRWIGLRPQTPVLEQPGRSAPMEGALSPTTKRAVARSFDDTSKQVSKEFALTLRSVKAQAALDFLGLAAREQLSPTDTPLG
jgi:hypothetical protein